MNFSALLTFRTAERRTRGQKTTFIENWFLDKKLIFCSVCVFIENMKLIF